MDEEVSELVFNLPLQNGTYGTKRYETAHATINFAGRPKEASTPSQLTYDLRFVRLQDPQLPIHVTFTTLKGDFCS